MIYESSHARSLQQGLSGVPLFEMMVAFLVSSVTLGLLYPMAPRVGLLDHPGERRKTHRKATPLIGGIAIFAGILVGALFVDSIGTSLIPGLIGATLLVMVGALDDKVHLRSEVRFLTQIAAALLLTLGSGFTLHSLGDLFGLGPIDLGFLAVPFTVFAMVGIINSINLIDGIDGLAGGLILIAFTALLLLAPAFGPVQIILLLAIAAIIPYLICNLSLIGCSGRKLFLGDAGSLLLGYLLVWGLVDAVDSPGGIEPVTALWIVAIPLMDTLRVMGKRFLEHHSPFTADAGHVHHLLACVFRSTGKALVTLLAVAILLATLGALGTIHGVSESVMFYLALACFAIYVLLVSHLNELAIALDRRRHTPIVDTPGVIPPQT